MNQRLQQNKKEEKMTKKVRNFSNNLKYILNYFLYINNKNCFQQKEHIKMVIFPNIEKNTITTRLVNLIKIFLYILRI